MKEILSHNEEHAEAPPTNAIVTEAIKFGATLTEKYFTELFSTFETAYKPTKIVLFDRETQLSDREGIQAVLTRERAAYWPPDRTVYINPEELLEKEIIRTADYLHLRRYAQICALGTLAHEVAHDVQEQRGYDFSSVRPPKFKSEAR